MSSKMRSGVEIDRPEGQADLTGVKQTTDDGQPIQMDEKEIEERSKPDFDFEKYQAASQDQPQRSDEVPGKRATGPGNQTPTRPQSETMEAKAHRTSQAKAEADAKAKEEAKDKDKDKDEGANTASKAESKAGGTRSV